MMRFKHRIRISFDNIKVKKKLIYIYIFCVLTPIVLINTIFYTKIYHNVEEEEIRGMNTSLERIESNIIRDIKECFAVANTINADSTFNEYLEKSYQNDSEFTQAYHEYLRQALMKYVPAYSQIERINVYLDNLTIINSSGFIYISDEIKDLPWYKKAYSTKEKIFISASKESRLNDPDNNSLYISIITKLNNSRMGDKHLKLLKIDLNPATVAGPIESQSFGGELYLLNNEGQVVYSTNNKYYGNAITSLVSFSNVETESNSIILNRDFGDFNVLKGWRIVGVFSEKKIFNALSESRNFAIILTLVSLLVASIIIYVVSLSLSKRLDIVSKHMKKLRKQDFEVIEGIDGNDEIGELMQEFNRMTTKIKNLIKDVYEESLKKQKLELERKQSQINALQSQINPHFLFNTLESIRMDCLINSETKASEVIKLMSKTFRRMLTWENDLIMFQEEVSFLEDFFKIQKYRFEDKLEYSIDIDPEVLNCLVPKMTFQPLVENAVVHGIREKKGIGFIKVEAKVFNGLVNCIVKDNGVGISRYYLERIYQNLKTDGYSKGSVGIKNVYSRLNLFYENNINFKIESEELGGTTISFTVPLLKKVEEPKL